MGKIVTFVRQDENWMKALLRRREALENELNRVELQEDQKAKNGGERDMVRIARHSEAVRQVDDEFEEKYDREHGKGAFQRKTHEMEIQVGMELFWP